MSINPAQKFILRYARERDAAAIREVARVTWQATYDAFVTEANRERIIATSYSDESLRQAFSRAGRDNWFWVADNLAGIIGFAEVILRPPDAELTRIYVLPTWQGLGVGRALIEVLLNDLRKLEADLRPPRLVLAVAARNANAIAFYEKRGFRYKRAFQAKMPDQMLDMHELEIEV